MPADESARAPATPAPSSALSAVFHHPRANAEVQLGGQLVAYELKRAQRRSIGFLVSTEGLSVSAPRWVGRGEIIDAVQSKSGWILRKLAEQGDRRRRLMLARVAWGDGTVLPYLGETVSVVLDPTLRGSVLAVADPALRRPGESRHMLRVGLPMQAESEQIRAAVKTALQRQARRLFEERCAHFAPLLAVQYTRLSLSSAQTRWGSASADGSIRLNWRLIHVGLPLIDYVVAHELAHLREMNHSPRFWELVSSVIPGYDDARLALKQAVLPVLD